MAVTESRARPGETVLEASGLRETVVVAVAAAPAAPAPAAGAKPAQPAADKKPTISTSTTPALAGGSPKEAR